MSSLVWVCRNSQALSALPSSKWADPEWNGALGCADTGEQLLRLQAAFAKARQLLREMGEVRACFPSRYNENEEERACDICVCD